MDRRLFLASLLGLPIVGPLGCSSVREPLLRVSGIVWVGYEPLFLARSLDLYDPARIRLVESPSNTNSLLSLATGEVEAATLTLDECLLARAGGVDVQVIAIFDTSNGADVVMARPTIGSLAELKGKRIGVEETAAGALMLSKTLDAAGLQPRDVIKVPVTGDQQLALYRGGKVDALISYEPYASQLAKAGAHRLYDSSHFPGVIVDVLVARKQAIARHPAGFARLLAGYFQAVTYLQQHPEEAYRRMAPRMQISPAEVKKAFAGIRVFDLADNRRWLAPGGRLQPAASTVAEIMLANRLIDHRPDLRDLGSPQFLPEGA